MMRFIAARLLMLVPTFFGITLVAFFLIRLVPGDPIEVMVGERRLDPETHARLVRQLGLDQPLAVQYARYLGQTLTGNLGTSTVSREPVSKELKVLFPATVELALAALALALTGGVTLGVVAALRRGTLIDQGVTSLATLGHSMPIFWWGLMLIMVFSVDLGLTPVAGRIAIEFDIEPRTGFMLVDSLLAGEPGAFGAFSSALSHLLLPALVLGTVPMATIARMTRSSLLEVLREDFMRSARARGLSPLRVVVVHGLRNALIPVITVVGLSTGALLGGAVLTETIFSWPGMGKWLVDSIARRDYPVVQAGILISALTFIAANLVVDLLYGVADPRIRER